MDTRSLASQLLFGSIAVAMSLTVNAQTSASSTPAPVEASNLQFFIGQRVWLATWDQPFVDTQLVLPNPASPVPVLQQLSKRSLSSTTAMPLTSLGIRYSDWTVAATFLPQTSFSTGGLAVGDTVRRDEIDLSLSYALAPNLSTSIVYKTGTVDKLATANATSLSGFIGSYKIQGLLFGISGNAQIRGPVALYGNFAIGPARQTVAVTGLPAIENTGIYQISEVGMTYRLTQDRDFLGFKNLSVQFGYRSQSVVLNDLPYQTYSLGPIPTVISTNLQSIQSATQGFVFGVVAAF